MTDVICASLHSRSIVSFIMTFQNSESEVVCLPSTPTSRSFIEPLKSLLHRIPSHNLFRPSHVMLRSLHQWLGTILTCLPRSEDKTSALHNHCAVSVVCWALGVSALCTSLLDGGFSDLWLLLLSVLVYCLSFMHPVVCSISTGLFLL